MVSRPRRSRCEVGSTGGEEPAAVAAAAAWGSMASERDAEAEAECDGEGP